MKTRKEEIERRSKFRFECLRRSPKFQELIDLFGLIKADIWDRKKGGYSKETRDYLTVNKIKMTDRLIELIHLAQLLPLIYKSNDPAELCESLFDLPSINVLSLGLEDVEKMRRKYIYNDLEDWKKTLGIPPRDFLFGYQPEIEEDNSVTIKLYLNRKKSDILNDIRCLLDTLKKFGKFKEHDNRFPLEDFEKYFSVYDSRQERTGNRRKKSWRRIAEEVFPGEDLENAKRKIRHYCKEVERYIQEEVWWQ